MFLVEPKTADGGLDWRYTFLRHHVTEQLGQTHKLDVLAVEDLLQQAELADPTARSDPVVLGHLNRRQFFYRSLTDQRLYVPVRVRVAGGYRHHKTDTEQYKDNALRHSEECKAASRENRKWRVRTQFDLRCFDDLTELILAMDGRLLAERKPDRRGVVLLSCSGAGKTVACRKAFYDCFYATPHEGAPTDASPRLAGFLPCWVSLAGDLPKLKGADLIRTLIARSAQSNPKDSPGTDDVRCCSENESRRGATDIKDGPSAEDVCGWLKTGPPLLLFFDLNSTADPAVQALVGMALLPFQQEYGRYGHRSVVTYRSTRADAPAMMALGSERNRDFGFYDLVPLDTQQATDYLATYRRFERETFNPEKGHLKHYAGGYKPLTEAQIEKACTKLAELIRRHVIPTAAGHESLISTPLLMHFVAWLPPDKVESIETLYDLYAAVVDKHLDRESEEYSSQQVQAGLDEAGREHVLTAMTRIALAIQARGGAADRAEIVARLPCAAARACLEGAMDSRTGLVADWVPEDDYWINAGSDFPKRSAYYDPEALAGSDHSALLEFSLLREEDGEIGFVHDSLIYYFTGALALVEYWRPGIVGGPNKGWEEDWVRHTVLRVSQDTEAWQLPAEFLAGRVAAADRLRRSSRHGAALEPLLHQLARELILACSSGPQLDVLRGYVRGGGFGDGVLKCIDEVLRLKWSFLTRFPGQAFGEVCNYLASIQAANQGRDAFLKRLGQRVGKRDL